MSLLTTHIERQKNIRETSPIIDTTFGQPKTTITNIKEIKPTIYLHSMINYFIHYFQCEYNNGTQKCLLLILDDLTNELRNVKYEKMGLVPNELLENSVVLLTNQNKNALEKILDFTTYDKVVIIDRYPKLNNMAQIKGENYYLIDSESDIFDYNLDSDRCQSFTTSNRYSRYLVSPNFDSETMKGDDRDIIAYSTIPLISLIVTDVFCNEW